MRKGFLMVSIVFVLAIALTGCATQGDLEKVQAQEQLINLKADQALKSAQEANETAAKTAEAVKASEERAKMSEERAKMAEERARKAEEKAGKADATFKQSMKK